MWVLLLKKKYQLTLLKAPLAGTRRELRRDDLAVTPFIALSNKQLFSIFSYEVRPSCVQVNISQVAEISAH